MMRTFIAIELPEDIQKLLNRIQEQLKSTGADVKWVQTKNRHITLKFLGEIDSLKLAEVVAVLEDTCRNQSRFTARIANLGAFPGINSPRVIWVGIDKGDEQIRQIARLLESGLMLKGFTAEEKPFSSHITIGRTRSSSGRDALVKAMLGLQNNFGKEIPEFNIEKIIIFKSTLTPLGPIYEPLKTVNLKAI